MSINDIPTFRNENHVLKLIFLLYNHYKEGFVKMLKISVLSFTYKTKWTRRNLLGKPRDKM